MSVRTDQVNLVINVNGSAAQNQLNELRKRAADIKHEMKTLKRGTDEYIDATKRLNEVNNQMSTLKKEIGITALSQKELTAELRKLRALQGSMQPFSAEFKEMGKQISAVESRLYDVRNGVTGLSSLLHKFKDEIKAVGVVATAYVGVQLVVTSIKALVTGAAALSDQLADVQRVTGLTAEETNRLNTALKQLDTRTSTSGLREIATIAGKLGVANKDVLEFTKAVDMLVVALGDELGDADAITSTLGKILNVFDGEITGDNITRLGNAFVELANTGAATGGFIADFDQRLSGIAKSAGISLGALSGLGAGLEEMGARVESSSTAVQKLIISISEDMPAAAKIAGETAEEFQKLFDVDPTEAMLRYAEGLVKNKTSFAQVTESLRDAGETGARTIETISKLGEGANQLRERILLGKAAMEETSAITDAFALKNETLGAQLEKVGKELTMWFTDPESGIVKFFTAAAKASLNFLKWLKDIPEFVRQNRTAISALTTVLLTYLAAKSSATKASIFARIELIAETVATKLDAAAKIAATAATRAYGIAKGVLTGQITAATAATRIWNFVLRQNPLVWVVLAVGGLITAISALTSKVKQLTAAQRVQNELQQKITDLTAEEEAKARSLFKTLQQKNLGYEAKKKLLNDLIAISPEYLKGLTLENIATKEGLDILDNYIEKLREVNRAKALNEVIMQKEQRLRQIETENKGIEQRGATKDVSFGGFFKDVGAALGIGSGSSGYQYMANRQEAAELEAELSELYKETANNITKTIQEGGDKEQEALANTVAARKKYLEKQISDLQTAYDQLNATDKRGQRANLAAQAKYQAELDALLGKEKGSGRSTGNRERDRLLQDVQRFQEDILKLQQAAADAALTQDERELAQLERKYAQMQARALEFYRKNAITKEQYLEADAKLLQTFNAELDELQKKQFARNSAEEYATALENSKSYFDEQRNLEGQRYAQGLQNKAQYESALLAIDLEEKQQLVNVAVGYAGTVEKAEKDLAQLRQDLAKATTAAEIAQAERRIQAAQQEYIAKAKLSVLAAPEGSKNRLEAQKELLRREFEIDTEHLERSSALFLQKQAELEAAMDMLDQDYTARRLQAMDELTQNLLSLTSNFFNALDGISMREFNKDKALNEAKKSNYKKQLDSKLMSQRQYDAAVAKADEDLDKKKREMEAKAFKRQQAMAITAALINGALAVTATLAARPGLADIFTLGTARAIQVGLVVAATAAQVAAIATQEPPKAARGRWFRKQGKKHRDGGIDVEIERDEAVIMAKAMNDPNSYTVTGTPAQITSKLNSMHGGLSWEPGAQLQPPRFMEPAPRFNRELPRIMEQGGVVRPLHPANAAVDLSGLEAVFENKFTQWIEATTEKDDSMRAVVSIKEYRKKEKQYDEARKAGSMNQN